MDTHDKSADVCWEAVPRDFGCLGKSIICVLCEFEKDAVLPVPETVNQFLDTLPQERLVLWDLSNQSGKCVQCGPLGGNGFADP
jgi:hypothetical protein